MTKALVQELVPVTEYDGSVYEQTVVLEITPLGTVDVFDGSMLVSEAQVGTEQEVTLLGLVSEFEVQPDSSESNIDRPDNSHSEWSYRFEGNVSEIDTNGMLIEGYNTILKLAIGTAEVYLKPNKECVDAVEQGRLTEGSAVSMVVSRLDVVSIT
jgi:hypothetical protein